MTEIFVPATTLEALIREGDYAKTVEHLRALTAAERQGHRSSVSRIVKLMFESRWKGLEDKGLIWGYQARPEQCRSAAAAALLCGKAYEAAAADLTFHDVAELARTCELPCLTNLAEALMERGPHRILLVQELIAAGVVERPRTEAYVIGLIAMPRFLRRGKSLADCFAEDPGLSEAVLRLFELQGTAENCLASADKYNAARNSWMDQVLALSRDGRIERSTLIDRTIGVLEQDWPQFRAGWFKRLHEALDVTPEEIVAHTSRYLRLCQSRIPPTVSLALEVLGQLEKTGQLGVLKLLDSLRQVFANGSKGQVEVALRLVQSCLKREPSAGSEAALILCPALVHDVPALQAKLIKQISPYAKDERVRDALKRHLESVAPSNRGSVVELVGDSSGAERARPSSVPASADVMPDLLDAEHRQLPPVRDHDELVQLVAHVFENDENIDAFERALCGLVQACPLEQADFSQFSPVLKRVSKLKRPLAVELGRLLRFVCLGERQPAALRLEDYSHPSRIHRHLQSRVEALMDIAEQGKREPLLSTPTHQRGAIDPSALVDRLRRHDELGITHCIAEQALAISRLVPRASSADLAELRKLPDRRTVRAVRYALGEEVEIGSEQPLYCAAARIRNPRGDDVSTLLRYGDLGPDGPRAAEYSWTVSSWSSGEDDKYVFHSLRIGPEVDPNGPADIVAIQRHAHPPGKEPWSMASRRSVAGEDPGLIKYSATLVPSDMEAFFAEGAREIGNNINWDEARWHHKAYLEFLLDPTVQPGPMALLLLACGLAAREPGQAALAVDALVQFHAGRKLDVALFAETLARLVLSSLVKVARLRKNLDSALLIDPSLAGPTLLVLLAILRTTASDLPRDHAKLLELMHELLLSTGGSLDPMTVDLLRGLKVAGAAKATLKKLYALEA